MSSATTPPVENIPGHRDHRSGDHQQLITIIPESRSRSLGIVDHHRPESAGLLKSISYAFFLQFLAIFCTAKVITILFSCDCALFDKKQWGGGTHSSYRQGFIDISLLEPDRLLNPSLNPHRIISLQNHGGTPESRHEDSFRLTQAAFSMGRNYYGLRYPNALFHCGDAINNSCPIVRH